jgi:thymidylate synthase (FAD)
MKVIEPTVEVMFFQAETGMSPEECIEAAGRTCYQSKHKVEAGSAPGFVAMVRRRGHHAMLEFGYAMARITADRGLTHELVRHRLASYAQESTRYCNYGKGKFGSEITVIKQPGIPEEHQGLWERMMARAEGDYLDLLKVGIKPEHARSVLPIGLKSEIVIGANLREWRHIFKMRCDHHAHPIIRGIMLKVFRQFYEKMPEVYEDQAQTFIPVTVGDVFAYQEKGFNWEAVVMQVDDEMAVLRQDATITLPKGARHELPLDTIYDKWKRVKLGPEAQ